LIRGIFKELEAREDVKELTEELEKANIRLKEIDVEKSTFVSIASHQLRTPLTLIKGYAAMLIEGSFGKIENPEVKRIIENILEASERLVNMIEDFLNISRIEQGKMSYKFSRLDLGTLTWSVVNELKAASKSQSEKITVHMDKNTLFPVMGDTLKIRQVLNNLLDNALKYSPKKSPIDILIVKREGKIIFSIKDKGIGISDKAKSKLFQKFSRADVNEKLKTEGRGLGLYVAKQIIAAHGGKIWAESEGNQLGSTFYLEFSEFSPHNSAGVDPSAVQVSTH